MIYYLFWPLTKLGYLLYFRKIFLLNVNELPGKGPVLIVCNHPSSFFEACLLAVMLPRSLHFLTRGDFFRKSLFAWFLRQTHQVPIFRSEDGFDKLRTNRDTFSFCYQALEEHKVIVIFPETKTETEKRLRTVQKGAARIAYGTLARGMIAEPLRILPVGVTFSDPVTYRSMVTVRCGTTIPVFSPDDTADMRALVNQLTDSIEQALKSLIIQIDRREREWLYDQFQLLLYQRAGNARFLPLSRDPAFPTLEQELASRINALSDEKAVELRDQVTAYLSGLRRLGITDRFLMNTTLHTPVGRILTVLLLPVLGIGKMFTFPPAWLIHRFLNKKVRRIPFYGPLKWAMGMFAYFVWFALIFVLGGILFGTPGLLIALGGLLAAFLNMQYFHDQSLKGMLASVWMPQKKRKALLEQREDLISEILSPEMADS